MVDVKREELLSKIINNIGDTVVEEDKVTLDVLAEDIKELIEYLVNKMGLKTIPTMLDFSEEQYEKIVEVANLFGVNPYQEKVSVDLDYEYIEEYDKISILLGFNSLFSKKTIEYYGEVIPGCYYEEDYLYTHPICDFHMAIVDLLEDIEELDFDYYTEDGGVIPFLNYAFGVKGINICDVYSITSEDLCDDMEEIEDCNVFTIQVPRYVYDKYVIE